MADISQYLQAIMTAVYGEDVRGSIHDAIEIINDVGEVVFSTGTAVSSASSSSTGFYEDSLYLNTNTFELWKCIGNDTWESQGVLKGDTGEAGADGNRWFRGTGISGKAVNPTVYSGSGIADANPNDFYLNPSEGAVYHCVTGGDASTATWSYDFTMTGGGGGGSVVGWNQIQTSTGATKIAEITIDGTQTDVYAPQGGGGSSTFAALSDVSISGTPAAGQMVQYVNEGGNIKLQNITPDASPTSSSIKPVQSGGVYTALSSKADTSELDSWITGNGSTTGVVISGSPNYFTFTGIDDTNNNGYKPFIQITDSSTNKNPTAQISSLSGAGTANMSITYSTDADVGSVVKLRRIK